MPSGLAAVLFATFPLFVALLAHFFLPGERLRTCEPALGVLIGFAGVAVLFSEDLGALVGPQVAFAAKVLLIAPVCVGDRQRGGQEVGSGSAPALGLGGLDGTWARCWSSPSRGSASGGGRSPSGPVPVLAVALPGGVGSAVAFTIYYWLLRRLPATSLSLINYATPVVAVLIGTLWLGEPFTLRILLGAGLVVVGSGDRDAVIRGA